MRRAALVASIAAVLGCCMAAALPPQPAPTITAQVTQVVDGDTIDVTILSIQQGAGISGLATGNAVRVRYIGIDAPEAGEPFGPEATASNVTLVGGRTVYLELDTDLWGDASNHSRLLAYVYLDQARCVMVNAILVALGMADAARYPPNTRYAASFDQLEVAAKSGLLGRFAASPPGPQTEATQAGSGTDQCCEYVGNKSSGVFHRKACPSVGQMSEANKVCFCTAQAARDAGYGACQRCNP